jgi:hypothetical protein
MSPTNRSATQASDAQIIAGIQKHLQGTASLPLRGSTYTPADLVKLVQSRMESANKAIAAKASWHSTVLAHKAVTANLTPILQELRQYSIHVFGESSPALADFGFAPPKHATRTPEEKAAAAAKARATRAARHTAGKKQKNAVKGNVTGIVITPVTASSAAPANASNQQPATPSPAQGATKPGS